MSDPKNKKLLIIKETVRGIITEALPSTLFRVKISARPRDNNSAREGSGAGGEDKMQENKESEKEILAYLSGKMRLHRIKVLIGDSVEIILDPYGGKGRIVKRL